jgi:predicted deacylase
VSNLTDLQHVVIGGSRSEPHLLITGGVHGDEFESMVAIRRLIAHFSDEDRGRALRGKLTLVPIVNEAAYLRGTRTAEDDLDLARVCPGNPDGSITERTAHALSELIRTADYYIDLHTGGTICSVWPMTGYGLHPDLEIRESQRVIAQAFNLPVIWATTPNLDGRSLSVARDAGIPAIYAEYHGSGVCDPQGVDGYYEGCLNVLGMLDMIDRPAPPSRVEHVLEDHRPNSGDMGLHNQSPVDGYFEIAVQLGDRVREGDLLGTVFDPVGSEKHLIRSERTGYVLTVRTYPRVLQGDMVAVIAEAN